MNADGSEARRLARDAAEPSWSPDGRKIAFKKQFRDRQQIGERQSDIYVMNADGSGQRNLARAAGNRESQPVWSPAQMK
jgi:Tol biopolymer transport system component